MFVFYFCCKYIWYPFFGNLSKEELVLLCQLFHLLSQVPILLVNLCKNGFLENLIHQNCNLIKLIGLCLGCVKPFPQGFPLSFAVVQAHLVIHVQLFIVTVIVQ